ncbi:hypothetical protein [Aureibacter tunicatorum]|uniref:Uncharacterized protein n=1 Tax=Aureibacter tunicatorum TaxID=866807 RepID=A0AAE3XN11_9BACT|nr:hypothetical protein [Aureibacter tunicatorum]MDR6238756.1 hypothetical protein [Aureibacter tunicatorum]BDD05313.1 hypothetical protein AUTU_27960 [Aureibacter tunicatorum]
MEFHPRNSKNSKARSLPRKGAYIADHRSESIQAKCIQSLIDKKTPVQRLITPKAFKEQTFEPDPNQRVFRYGNYLELQTIERLLYTYNNILLRNIRHQNSSRLEGSLSFSRLEYRREDMDDFHQAYAPPQNEEIAHQMLSLLQEMEDKIFSMIGTRGPVMYPQFDNPEGAVFYRKALLELLEDIQRDHIQIIKYIRANNLRLWVPDITRMGRGEADRIQELWRSVTDGKQGLRYKDRVKTGALRSEHVEGFLDKVHAMNAKLMSVHQGRDLLSRVNAMTDYPVKIVPHNLSNQDKNESISFKSEGLIRADNRRNRGVSPTVFLPHSISDIHQVGMATNWTTQSQPEESVDSPLEGARAIANFMMSMVQQTVPRVTQSHAHERRRSAESESDSDSSFDDIEEFAISFKEGDYVLHPSYIRYAKMLGMALNAQEGSSRINKEFRREEDLPWKSNEEKDVVTFVENPIREDFSLPKRKWATLFDTDKLGWR